MTGRNYRELVKRLIEFAVSSGADRSLTKEIKTCKIVVPKQWVKWKCYYGCPSFGRKLSCPPYTPGPAEIAEMLQEYQRALIIGFSEAGAASNKLKYFRETAKTLVMIEREAFLLGFVKAFALGAGPCYLCDKCIIQDLPKDMPLSVARAQCRHHKLMRPSAEALGIDMFSTVKNAGLDIEVINDDNADRMKHFGILLIK